MRIDLHTHSSVSDGTDVPDALVRAAASAGLDVVGLTDHDTVDGWAPAAAAAAEAGIELVPGTEISTTLRHDGVEAGIHLLAYWFDPDHPGLAAALADIRSDRELRLQRIVAALQAAGVDLTLEEVLAEAGAATAVGRPHVADALVRKGLVADRDEAFDRYLASGRPGAIPKHAPDLEHVIAMVTEAGGVTVLAHPWGRSSRRVLPPEIVGGLARAGLGGLEVDHEDHEPAVRAELRALAEELDLVPTGSSDYHGTGKADHELGINTTSPEAYARLRARARSQAARAAR